MLGLVLLLRLADPLAAEAVAVVALPTDALTAILAGRYETYQTEAGSTLLLTSAVLIAVIPLFQYITNVVSRA